MNRYIKLEAVLDRIAEAYSKHNELVPMWLHIGDIPYADVVEVRHGRWIRKSMESDNSSAGYFEIAMAECSECGTCVMGKPNYCPNCGARMDGEE